MLTLTPENAIRVLPWLERDGAFLHWYSVNLSNPGAWWLTPLREGKPSWQAVDQPNVITAADLQVTTYKEVKSLRIYTRVSSNGLMIKLTDSSSRRVRQALENAGEGAVYRFEGNYAVISVPDQSIPYTTWKEQN